MKNFYDSEMTSLEGSISPIKESVKRNLFNIILEGSYNTLYYVKYEKPFSDSVPTQSISVTYNRAMLEKKMKPNQRLLDQFADMLQRFEIDFERTTLNIMPYKQRVVKWKIPRGFGFSYAMISSNPFELVSYFDVTLFGTNKMDQANFSFVAQSPIMIYQKLLSYDLIQTKKKGGHDE